jgi:hypothetical protein
MSIHQMSMLYPVHHLILKILFKTMGRAWGVGSLTPAHPTPDAVCCPGCTGIKHHNTPGLTP